mmetsp:Transcript_7800/g.8371  ORF Transcript_7800/g.8371 Transcript_7800/m.8371 type:complete len:207 (+) Transcript_7800:116-736(+)
MKFSLSSFLFTALLVPSTEVKGACTWTPISGKGILGGFAGGTVAGQFSTVELAQAKCLELGTSVCRAVTCGIDANFGTNGCTVRESAQLDPSLTGETSYVPSTELCEEVCEPVCQDWEVCTFEVGRDELSSELGYYEFKGVGGATCPGTNPVLGTFVTVMLYQDHDHGAADTDADADTCYSLSTFKISISPIFFLHPFLPLLYGCI